MCESLGSEAAPDQDTLYFRTENTRDPAYRNEAHTDQPERGQAPAADLLGRKLISRVLD